MNRLCRPGLITALLMTSMVVTAAETVTITPSTVDGPLGQATLLTASAPTVTQPTWQWRHLGRAIPGQTADRLIVPHQPQNLGAYDVVARNADGTWCSPAVPLTTAVDADSAPVLHLQPAADGNPVDASGRSEPTVTGKDTPPRRSDGPAGLAAWDFHGEGRHVVIPAGPALEALGNPRHGSGLSLALWLRLPTDRAKTGKVGGRITSNRHVLALDPLLYAVEDAEGGLFIQFGAHVYEAYHTFRVPTLADGAWHHVALTVDQRSGLGACYVDGRRLLPEPARPAAFQKPVLRFMSDLPWGSTKPLHLGADAKGGNPWTGGLADFRVYARAIAPSEVTALAAGQEPTPVPQVRIAPVATVLLPKDGQPVTVPMRCVAVGETLTYRWIPRPDRGMPREALRLEPGEAGQVQATFAGPGTYRVACVVTDKARQIDQDEVAITVASNQPPTISALQAGTPTVQQDGSRLVTLAATALDDGLPQPPSFLTTTWTQFEGPVPARLARPDQVTTTAVLPKPGTYRFRLVASDGALSATTDLTVDATGITPPKLTTRAEPARLDLLRAPTAQLIGAIDGPAEATTWSQVDGPAPATITTPGRLTSAVTLPRPGQYRFALTGARSGVVATTWINAWMPGAVTVDTGSSRVVWLPEAVLDLRGTTSAGATAHATWTRAEGPGPVTFSTADRLTTRATFTVAGTYALRLTVEDGPRCGSDLLVVEVYPPERDFGYSAEQRRGFTGNSDIPRDVTGLDWERIGPVPPTGVHPRLLFGPEDLPELRQRLSTGTIIGPKIMADIRQRVTVLRTKPEYAALLAALAKGDTTLCDAPRAPLNELTDLMKLEAFRILIDQDTAAAPPIIAATVTLAERARLRLAAEETAKAAKPDAKPGHALGPTVHTDKLAWVYDFLYDAMTPSQRTSVRRLMVEALDSVQPLGTAGLPGLYSSCSNWVPLIAQSSLYCALAIEGEEGSRPEHALAYAALVSRSCFGQALPDGSTVEGGGKGWIGIPSFYALAKRGHMSIASTSLRRFMDHYLLHSREPHGHGFTFEEMNGGSNNRVNFIDDVLVMKHLFPQDPRIDFIYRSSFSTKGEDLDSRAGAYIGGPVLAAVCARDVTSSLPWEQALARDIAPTTPLTGRFDDRGLVITRSDWSPQAVRLWFQPRIIRGGHMQADRNAIVVNGLGRTWLPMFVYQSGSGHVAGDSSMSANIVRVDDQPSGIAPAALRDFVNMPRFTSATGDASDAYRLRHGAPKGTANAPITSTYNQRRLKPLAEGWADLAESVLPSWMGSQKGDWQMPLVRPEARAFRTAALVRGVRPYVLVADDLRMDANPHRYAWRTMLSDDLRGRGKISGKDVIYTEPEGKRALLIRVLACAGTPDLAIDNHYEHFKTPWFDAKVEAIDPAFRIFIMPFAVGTPLPTTSFDGRLLTVDHGSGKIDRLTFRTETAGWTRIVPDHITSP